MPHALHPVKPRTAENLSARVYSQIKNIILSNAVMPGQKLHHQQLSERLGASRTPVREALTGWYRKAMFPFYRWGFYLQRN